MAPVSHHPKRVANSKSDQNPIFLSTRFPQRVDDYLSNPIYRFLGIPCITYMSFKVIPILVLPVFDVKAAMAPSYHLTQELL